MKTSELISRTIEVLEQRGWTKGHYEDGRGFCLMGAVGKASDEAGHRGTRERFLIIDAIYKVLPAADQEILLTTWNDRKSRTFPQVVKLLEKARDVALEQES